MHASDLSYVITVMLNVMTGLVGIGAEHLTFFLTFIYLPQNTNNKEIKQNSNTKANKSGEEAQKKPWGL